MKKLWIVALCLLLVGCGGTPTEGEPLPTYTPLPPLPTFTVGPTQAPYPTYTPVPTGVPAPAATSVPEPTPAPTLAPEPIQPELEILGFTDYEDIGWFHVLGEVRNNGSYPVEYVKIVVTIYDDAGNMAGQDYTYTELDVIPPGGRSPFMSGTDEHTGVSSYEVKVKGQRGTLGRQDLVIRGDSSFEDNIGWLHIRGEVINTGDTDAEYVKIIVTLYDAEGHFVGMDFAYTDLDVVPAGGTSPFETGTDHWPGFDHYELQVQGQ